MKIKYRNITWLALLALAVMNRQLSSANAQLAFTTNTYNVGSQPYCVVAADVNGDGKLDLISANQGTNTLTMLTNNGSGIFSFNTTLKVGSGPLYVVAADVNGDGKLELISANGGTNTLTVLTNNGFGVFGSNATLTVGRAPYCVVATDVNNDGNLDLVSANVGDNTLTVLTNKGNGVFGSNATVNVGFGPVCVVASDIRGVGKQDLVCANFTDGTLSVLTNNGSGVFGSNATLKVGRYPTSVVSADINGDGKPDLISVNSQDFTLTVLTNNGNGSGVFGSNATLTVSKVPQSVVAADINGDGKPDLISVSSSTSASTLTVLTNNGSGFFVYNATLTVGNGSYFVAAADLNGDGKLDLVTANISDSTLTVLINLTPFPTIPIVNIASIGNQVAVLWPAWAANRVLESTTNLSNPNWVTVANGAPIVGVTLTNTSPPLFFRLR